jgi:hypothetical protein
MTRFQLTREESAMIGRRPAKVGYIGTVQFRGPRGRKYRGVRTEARATLDRAIADVAAIRARQYRNGAVPTSDDIHAVDFMGRVVEAS